MHKVTATSYLTLLVSCVHHKTKTRTMHYNSQPVSAIFHNIARNYIIFLLLFTKLAYTYYIFKSQHTFNVAYHWFSIRFNIFMLATTTSTHDITAIILLMNSLLLACKWSIHNEHIHTSGSWHWSSSNTGSRRGSCSH